MPHYYAFRHTYGTLTTTDDGRDVGIAVRFHSRLERDHWVAYGPLHRWTPGYRERMTAYWATRYHWPIDAGSDEFMQAIRLHEASWE